MTMPNPFADMNPANPMRGYDFAQLRSLYQNMQKGMSPAQMLGQMASRNPNAQRVMQALQGGANPQQLFTHMCQQRGIDPNAFLANIIGNNGR